MHKARQKFADQAVAYMLVLDEGLDVPHGGSCNEQNRGQPETSLKIESGTDSLSVSCEASTL